MGLHAQEVARRTQHRERGTAMTFRSATGLTIFTLSIAACGGGDPSTAACGRDCLIFATQMYLDAVVSTATPSGPLADMAFVENVTRLKPGEGLWATATSGPTDFAIYVPDVEQQQAGFMGVMEREGDTGNQPVLVAVRLEVEDDEITAVEHIVAGVKENNMARLQS